MATNFQAVDSQLDKIKSTLQGISSSLASSTPKQREQLSSAFKDLGGTLSSEQARRSVANAQASAPGTTPTSTSEIDPLTKALQEKAQSDARAKEAEAKKKEAEATTSIADQRALKNKTKTGTSSTAGVDGAPVEDKKMAFQELMQREPMLGDYGLTEENMADPMVIATLRNQVARSQQIEQDAARLQEMVGRKEARTQQQVALIGQSVANQTAQLQVEQRKRMAATGMAGLLTGRSLYSPEEHQGIIQEVVQEGILKLQEIQIEGYKLQNEMWDDFDNYEYEAYTKKSEMLKEYNKLELDTVTAVQTRLQQVAKQAQEKLVFDQQQMDRSSLILGEELVGASDDVIRQTALEQGIDYGLLKKAVADATFTKQDRDLSLTSKRLSIAASQKALSGTKEVEKPLTGPERVALIKEYGLVDGNGNPLTQIPIGWRESDFANFAASYNLNGADATMASKYIDEYEDVISGKLVPYSEADDTKKGSMLKDTQETLKAALSAVPDSDKDKLDKLGVTRAFWDSRATEKTKLLESAKVKENIIKYLEQGYSPTNVVDILMETSLNQ